MNTLSYLRGRRLWVIRDYSVYGLDIGAGLQLAAVENIESSDRVIFGDFGVGETAQDIRFSDLTDFRGNQLPEKIDSPKVVIRFQSRFPVYMVGHESDYGLRVVRDPSAPGPIKADFFIFELGN